MFGAMTLVPTNHVGMCAHCDRVVWVSDEFPLDHFLRIPSVCPSCSTTFTYETFGMELCSGTFLKVRWIDVVDEKSTWVGIPPVRDVRLPRLGIVITRPLFLPPFRLRLLGLKE